MELSSFVGRMFALKNELLSILPKVTDAKTYLSNMDQIFMILTLIKLGIEFDNIREPILTGSTISTFDEIFSRLLYHSSTATRSQLSEVSNETLVMLAPSHPSGDSLEVFVVAIEAKASDFVVPTLIDWVTFETGVISYMVVCLALLTWHSLLNCLHLHLRIRLRLHLKE